MMTKINKAEAEIFWLQVTKHMILHFSQSNLTVQFCWTLPVCYWCVVSSQSQDNPDYIILKSSRLHYTPVFIGWAVPCLACKLTVSVKSVECPLEVVLVLMLIMTNKVNWWNNVHDNNSSCWRAFGTASLMPERHCLCACVCVCGVHTDSCCCKFYLSLLSAPLILAFLCLFSTLISLFRERELHLMFTYFTDRHWSCDVLYCWYEAHMTINRTFSLCTFAIVCASRGKNRRHAEALIKHRLSCSANEVSVAALTS